MPDFPMMPIAGMNNVADDAALYIGGDSPRLYARDITNFDISASGKATLRPGTLQVSNTGFRNLWQSPIHRDVFGTLGDKWVRIDPYNWSHEVLADVGEGDVSHELLNNVVAVAAPAGLFEFNGQAARRLTLDTPAPPLVVAGDGALEAGTYGVSVAWLIGGIESAPSRIAFIDLPSASALEITLPLCMQAGITAARLYLTQRDGGQLRMAGDYPINSPTIRVPLLPKPGRVAAFQHLEPMPTGKWLKYWRGRLLVAQSNVLRWSEALAYHLHDARHSFVQLPQRITFVQPVDGGVWVGQADHVVFLRGAAPSELTIERKASRAPVPGSAMSAPAEIMGELAQGGGAVAVWLADNGYVAGTASGALVELHLGKLKGISGRAGTSVVLDRRLVTAVT